MKNSTLTRKLKSLMLIPGLAVAALQAHGQLSISGINSVYSAAASGTTYTALGAPGSTLAANTYTYRFGTASGTTNNILNILSFQAGANTYCYRNQPNALVKIRRNNNAEVTGMRQLLWFEATSVPPATTINLSQPYQPNMEVAFNGAKGLNAGTDNIFCNTGDVNGNNNNIERFDYIIPTGNVIGIAAEEGFTVMDRGVLGAHDKFCVAVITAIDGSNNPTAYTNTVLRINASHFGSVNPITSIETNVMRLDGAEANLKISINTPPTQGIGGVFVSYADLGLTAGQTVYGYSIVGNDFPVSGVGSDLVNWSNTTFFPTNTVADDGGLDMIAVSGIFKQSGDVSPTTSVQSSGLLCNPTGSGPIPLTDPLTATDFNPGGSITGYVIYTLPSASDGVLNYFNGVVNVPVTEGQTLTPAEAAALSFDAVDGFNGTASFVFYAINNTGLLSNNSTYSIPVSHGPTPDFTINDNIQELTGNNFVFTSSAPTSGNDYAWTLGDGGVATTPAVTHVYTAVGIYTVTQTVTEIATGCTLVTPHEVSVLSDSVDGGSGGGLESESLGGLVSLRDFNNIKNSKTTKCNYNDMTPLMAQNLASAKTTGSNPGSTLEKLTPTSLDANTSAYETSPTDLVEITKAVQAYSVDYVRDNKAKAVVLGILTNGKVYTHTKSICDRLRGATLIKTEVKNIQGYNFIQYTLRRAEAMEYVIAFDAGKSAGRNTFALQTDWLISQYAGDDSVFAFQVWAADPSNTEILVNKLLNNLKTIMPVQQTDPNFKLPAAFVANGVRNKGFLDVTITNNTNLTSAELRFDERVTETAKEGSLIFPMTLVPGQANKFSIPIKDGYEYPGSLYLNGELVDMVYMADGNWSVDYDLHNTKITKYTPENEPDRIYADNEYPVYRSLTLKGNSSDYFSAYKFIASGNAKADLTKYHSVKFYAKGTGTATITLVKKGIVNWNNQYRTTISLDSAGRDYALSFADFTAANTKEPFTAEDVTTVVYTCTFNSVPTDFDFHVRKLAFSAEEVMSYNLLHSKSVTLSPNPNSGNFSYDFYSDVNQQLDMIIMDMTGKTITKQQVAATIGRNSVQVSLPSNISSGVYMVSMGNQQTQYAKIKVSVSK